MKVSSNFKRVAFAFLTVFAVAALLTALIDSFAPEKTAMAFGVGLGLGAGILAYVRFPVWFGNGIEE